MGRAPSRPEPSSSAGQAKVNTAKLGILAAGYPLAIWFATYEPSGAIRASSDRHVVPGTFLVDLDSGAIVSESADFQWSQRTETIRTFEPLNGAVFGLWMQ
jgi:hypothetical protein